MLPEGSIVEYELSDIHKLLVVDCFINKDEGLTLVRSPLRVEDPAPFRLDQVIAKIQREKNEAQKANEEHKLTPSESASLRRLVARYFVRFVILHSVMPHELPIGGLARCIFGTSNPDQYTVPDLDNFQIYVGDSMAPPKAYAYVLQRCLRFLLSRHVYDADWQVHSNRATLNLLRSAYPLVFESELASGGNTLIDLGYSSIFSNPGIYPLDGADTFREPITVNDPMSQIHRGFFNMQWTEDENVASKKKDAVPCDAGGSDAQIERFLEQHPDEFDDIFTASTVEMPRAILSTARGVDTNLRDLHVEFEAPEADTADDTPSEAEVMGRVAKAIMQNPTTHGELTDYLSNQTEAPLTDADLKSIWDKYIEVINTFEEVNFGVSKGGKKVVASKDDTNQEQGGIYCV